MAEYQDDTHITTVGDFQTVAQWLRTKMYGMDVREALAQAIERAGESADRNDKVAEEFKVIENRLPEIQKDFDNLKAEADRINELLPEISTIDASIQDPNIKDNVTALANGTEGE